MKIDINELPSVLKENGVEQEKIKSILLAAEQLAAVLKEEAAAEKAPEDKKKNEFVVAMYEHDLKAEQPLAYVLTQKEGEDAGLILSRLSDAAREFNNTKKGKKRPILDFGEVFSSLKRKFVKMVAGGINIKTHEQVRVLVIKDNKLI